jgi:hypothetical protein
MLKLTALAVCDMAVPATYEKVAVTSTAAAGMVKVAVPPSLLIVDGLMVTPEALNATCRPLFRDAVRVTVAPSSASLTSVLTDSPVAAPLGLTITA